MFGVPFLKKRSVNPKDVAKTAVYVRSGKQVSENMDPDLHRPYPISNEMLNMSLVQGGQNRGMWFCIWSGLATTIAVAAIQ